LHWAANAACKIKTKCVYYPVGSLKSKVDDRGGDVGDADDDDDGGHDTADEG